MKTNELIRQLQEADPSGEEQVSVGNVAIWDVSKEPSYYDGCQQVLKLDPEAKYYNVIGAEIRGYGDKIVINSLSIKGAMWNKIDIPVTYDGKYAEDHYKEHVEKWREEAKEVKSKIKQKQQK